MPQQRQFPAGSRVEDLDLSGVRLHGANLEGARLTDSSLIGADISGDIEGLVLNGVEIEPLVQAELERREPVRTKLRATDVGGLLEAWSIIEQAWAETTDRARLLPEGLQQARVEDEWSFVETLRHLIFATDCWLSRAIQLDPDPYHPWGLPWSGAGPAFAQALRLDSTATPNLEQILPVRFGRQRAVQEVLGDITDETLTDVRTAPATPGHPRGSHSVLHCLHVLLNEEWQHHRYAVRDLDILERSGPGGS